jgi:hypothetical protein
MPSAYRPATIEPSDSSDDNVESSPLVQPFTMMVYGPTLSGKTFWLHKLYWPPNVFNLLSSWCYGQWQPAYEHMSRTLPNIEVVWGITAGLECDSYFEPSVSNLIILDDVMITAKNDNCVGNLFTKGSHHRSLSTIYVVQNLFAQGRASLKEKTCHSTANTKVYCLICP